MVRVYQDSFSLSSWLVEELFVVLGPIDNARIIVVVEVPKIINRSFFDS